MTQDPIIKKKKLCCTAIDLLVVDAVYMDFGSARVSVEEFSFPGLTECTRDVLYQTVPNVFGVPSPPGPAVGSGASLTVRNLDFCTTNYSFLLTPSSIHNVNGTAVSTDVISGNRQGDYTVREKIPDWGKGIGYQVAPLLCDLHRLA